VLSYLEALTFTPEDRAYLATTGLFSSELLNWLSGVRFSGSVRALPEATVFFPQEPLLEITAPIIEHSLSNRRCSTRRTSRR